MADISMTTPTLTSPYSAAEWTAIKAALAAELQARQKSRRGLTAAGCLPRDVQMRLVDEVLMEMRS